MTKTDRLELNDALLQCLMLELLLEEDAELDVYLEETTDSETGASSDEDMELRLESDEVLEMMADLHSRRYLHSRVKVNKPMSLLMTTLSDYRHSRPEIFRQYLRVWPQTFDAIVERIQGDSVFHNNSHNAQLPLHISLPLHFIALATSGMP
jgi:hypothetical protein